MNRHLGINPIVLSIALVISLFPAGAAKSAVSSDAASRAMAESYTAVAGGYSAIRFNPANLGFPDDSFLQLQIFDASSILSNNSFSLSDYNRYNGEYLSERDRYDILSLIPRDGLQFRGNASLSTLSLSAGPFVFSTVAHAAGGGSVSKDLVDLAFFGNAIGKTVSIDDADAEALAHVDLNFAYGMKVAQFSDWLITAGANLKYIHGIAWYDISKAEGSALTGTDGIDADGSVFIRSAAGGKGAGLDLGIASKYRDDWIFSAGFLNLLSFIDWNRETSVTEYRFDVTSLSLDNSDEDSTVVSEEIEREIGSFRSALAPQINLGAAHEKGDFLFAADAQFTLAEVAGFSTTPRLSIGTEFRHFSFLPLRAGFSLGGTDRRSFAIGAGFRIGPFYFDLAWASSGSVLPTIHNGFSLALSSGLDFRVKEDMPARTLPDLERIEKGPDIF
ncbi:MAG: hypothetical protein JW814_08455 [Candidatus Krumholzibacteriota bacterium]|nr:hypothetical protein [Candidatus Krumholzibacteriota bacterium]